MSSVGGYSPFALGRLRLLLTVCRRMNAAANTPSAVQSPHSGWPSTDTVTRQLVGLDAIDLYPHSLHAPLPPGENVLEHQFGEIAAGDCRDFVGAREKESVRGPRRDGARIEQHIAKRV